MIKFNLNSRHEESIKVTHDFAVTILRASQTNKFNRRQKILSSSSHLIIKRFIQSTVLKRNFELHVGDLNFTLVDNTTNKQKWAKDDEGNVKNVINNQSVERLFRFRFSIHQIIIYG